MAAEPEMSAETMVASVISFESMVLFGSATSPPAMVSPAEPVIRPLAVVVARVVRPVTPRVEPRVVAPAASSVPEIEASVMVVVARVAELVATRSVVVAVLVTTRVSVVSSPVIVADAAWKALVIVAESAARAPCTVKAPVVVAVVNTAVDGVVAPMVVSLIVPPSMVRSSLI